MSNAKRALLLNDTSLTGNHGSHLVIDRLIELAKRHDIRISQRHALSVPLDGLSTDEIDLVIVNGEGSLHHSTKAARAIAAVPAWAANRGIQPFLINSIYQENSAAILEGVSKYKQIYVRDPRSSKELEALGVKPRGVVDLSLTWEPECSLDEGRSVVVVMDSTVPKTNSELFDFSRRLRNGYFMPFRSLPPTVDGREWQNAIRSVHFGLRKLAANMRLSPLNRARYANILPSFDQFVSYICRKARMIVAGRHHAVSIALNLKIPFVAVPSNSFKVEALLEDVGLQHRLISRAPEELTESELLGKFGAYTDDELARIEAYLASQRSNAHLMFGEISSQCSQRVA